MISDVMSSRWYGLVAPSAMMVLTTRATSAVKRTYFCASQATRSEHRTASKQGWPQRGACAQGDGHFAGERENQACTDLGVGIVVNRMVPHHPLYLINLSDVAQQDAITLSGGPHSLVDAVVDVGGLVEPLQHVETIDGVYQEKEFGWVRMHFGRDADAKQLLAQAPRQGCGRARAKNLRSQSRRTLVFQK